MWFRVHCEILDNQKLHELTPELFRALVLSWAAARIEGGGISSIERFAFYLRLGPKEAARLMTEMEDAGLMEGVANQFVPAGPWDFSPERGRLGRSGLSKATRFGVLERDNFTCRYCGRRAPGVELHVDHVHPVSLGGDDSPENLVAACSDCNLGKHGKPLSGEQDGE